MRNVNSANARGVQIEMTGAANDRTAVYANVNSTTVGYSGYLEGRLYVNPSIGISVANPSFNLQLANNSAAKPGSALWTVISDQRLKSHEGSFNDGLNILKQLDPIWFSYNGKGGITKGERGVGLMAQDLNKIAPYMVQKWKHYPNDKNVDAYEEYLAIDYGAMDFIIINAIKEQQKLIEENAAIKEENKKLRKTMDAILRRVEALEAKNQ